MTASALLTAAERFGTPLYVYDLDAMLARLTLLRSLFNNRFAISYAIKANPNPTLLRTLQPQLDTFDASSFSEVLRAIAAGMPAGQISFSGPAKRRAELDGAVSLGVGEMVVESLAEAQALSYLAQTRRVIQPCLVRINPLNIPRKFGASMAGTASQFGVDEEMMAEVLPQIAALPGLQLGGFHIYSGTNCLDASAISENIGIMARIFSEATAITRIRPRRLIFGSGFGVPYLPDEQALDHEALPQLILPILDELQSDPAMAQIQPTLELGRWLVAPAGWLLTRVVGAKTSRGKEIRLCDAGFNNHLAACGMMGSVFRRNWIYENLSNANGAVGRYTLVGPLCTTIDRLAADLDLPEPRPGDVIAVPQSGAYGLTSSPTRFISHPEPREAVLRNGHLEDASETVLNHWPEETRL